MYKSILSEETNKLVENINVILYGIIKKMVLDKCWEWDMNVNSVFWPYRVSYKIAKIIYLCLLAFGQEVVLPLGLTYQLWELHYGTEVEM